MKIYRKGVKSRRRVVKAEDELDVEDTPMPEGEGDVSVDPEATDLLFEAEDVAQLVAEVTGEDVEVTIDDEADNVSFAVGEDIYTVEPDEDVDVLESCKTPKKSSVKASRATRRQTPARRRNTRVIKRGTSRR